MDENTTTPATDGGELTSPPTEPSGSADDLLAQLLASPDAEDGGSGDGSGDGAPPAVGPLKLGSREYDPAKPEDVSALFEAAKNIEASSTQRFQEAAEERKRIEADKARLSDMETVWTAWNSGDAEMQDRILNWLDSQRVNRGAPRQGLGEIPQESVDTSQFTPQELFLYQQVESLRKQNEQLTQHFATVKPTLEEVSSFVGMSKAERELHTTAQSLASQGIKVTPEQVKEMREKFGISDPMKALPFLKAAYASTKAASTPPPPPTEIPSKGTIGGDTYDPNTMSADEILANYLAGRKPIS